MYLSIRPHGDLWMSTSCLGFGPQSGAAILDALSSAWSAHSSFPPPFWSVRSQGRPIRWADMFSAKERQPGNGGTNTTSKRILTEPVSSLSKVQTVGYCRNSGNHGYEDTWGPEAGRESASYIRSSGREDTGTKRGAGHRRLSESKV